jgi:hypothetical protein
MKEETMIGQLMEEVIVEVEEEDGNTSTPQVGLPH